MLKDIALLLMAAATLTGCMSSNAVEKEPKKVSKPLSFTVKSLDGKEVDLNKYQGKREHGCGFRVGQRRFVLGQLL